MPLPVQSLDVDHRGEVDLDELVAATLVTNRLLRMQPGHHHHHPHIPHSPNTPGCDTNTPGNINKPMARDSASSVRAGAVQQGSSMGLVPGAGLTLRLGSNGGGGGGDGGMLQRQDTLIEAEHVGEVDEDEDLIDEAFQLLDHDHDGIITADDIMYALPVSA